MSPVAYAVFTYLQALPTGRNVVMEELILAVHSSKTAVRAALSELEGEGLLSWTQET